MSCAGLEEKATESTTCPFTLCQQACLFERFIVGIRLLFEVSVGIFRMNAHGRLVVLDLWLLWLLFFSATVLEDGDILIFVVSLQLESAFE